MSDHHSSNFSYKSQVFQRKHPVLGIKLNPLSLLFQLVRYHRNNTNKRLQNNGFRSLQRHHTFSVALCIMRMRVWWLARARHFTEGNKGRDPFNQNFRKFRSKIQWIGSVQPEKFRKNWSTFWGGPLFPVGPVWILVKWITPKKY